jgi:phosphatidylglycerophosphate synthase
MNSNDFRAPAHGDTPTSGDPAVLVLMPGPAGSIDAEHKLLGLTLRQRAILAARRAGYARTVVAGETGGADDGHGADWRTAADAAGGKLVIVPTNALAAVDWLEEAAKVEFLDDEWAHAPGRVAIVDGATLRAMDAGFGGNAFDRIEGHLAAELQPAHTLPDRAVPMLIAGPADLPKARRRLLRALVKDTDGFMARHVERPISIAISRWLAETPITPNQMTLVSVAFGLVGAPFFLSASPVWQTIGALLFLWHSILDGCDGELARLKFQESHWGGVLDFWGDNVVHTAVFACMGIGWANAVSAGWPLALGAAAVLGTVGSATFVYVRTMRQESGAGPLYTSVGNEPSERMTKLLDSASRRDFIYLVVGFSLFGKASWFLVLTAVGAPVYFLLLLVVAMREARTD